MKKLILPPVIIFNILVVLNFVVKPNTLESEMIKILLCLSLLISVIVLAYAEGTLSGKKKYLGKSVDTLDEGCAYQVISKALHPVYQTQLMVLTLLKSVGSGGEVVTLMIKPLLLSIKVERSPHIDSIPEYFIVGIKEQTKPHLLLMDSCAEEWTDRQDVS